MPEYTIAQYLRAKQVTLPMDIDPHLEYGSLDSLGPKIARKQPAKLIVIGLGNPLLGDDGVGWVVVQTLKDQLAKAEIETDLLAGGGLSLMERLVGYTPPSWSTRFTLAVPRGAQCGHFPWKPCKTLSPATLARLTRPL